MKITENIIDDLMPAYLSGEASEDTKNLVQSFFNDNPDVAKKYDSVSFRIESHQDSLVVSSEVGNNETQLLSRTKRMLKFRTTLFVCAIFFSAMPLGFGSFSWDNYDGVRWLWVDYPQGAIYSGIIAVMLWSIYLALQKKLRVTGL